MSQHQSIWSLSVIRWVLHNLYARGGHRGTPPAGAESVLSWLKSPSGELDQVKVDWFVMQFALPTMGKYAGSSLKVAGRKDRGRSADRLKEMLGSQEDGGAQAALREFEDATGGLGAFADENPGAHLTGEVAELSPETNGQ